MFDDPIDDIFKKSFVYYLFPNAIEYIRIIGFKSMLFVYIITTAEISIFLENEIFRKKYVYLKF